MLMFFSSGELIGIFAFNVFAIIIYYSSLIQFYRISTRFWYVLFNTIAPIVVVLVINIIGGSLTSFFIETFFLEVGSMLIGIIVAMYLVRPSGWSGAILVSPVVIFFLWTFGSTTSQLLIQGGLWSYLIYGGVFLQRCILHIKLYIPPALGKGLPVWIFGKSAEDSATSTNYISPIKEEHKKVIVMGFGVALIAVFIFLPIIIAVVGGLVG